MFDGSLILLIVTLFIDSHSTLLFLTIEDILFPEEKMGVFGGIKHNWGYYSCYFIGIPF